MNKKKILKRVELKLNIQIKLKTKNHNKEFCYFPILPPLTVKV